MIPTLLALHDRNGAASARARLAGAELPAPAHTLERGRCVLFAWGDVHRDDARALVAAGAYTSERPYDGDAATIELRDDALVLASAPCAGRTLYYARGRDHVVAGSRLEWVLALLGERPPLDVSSLAALAAGMGAGHREETPYRGVRALSPGRITELRESGAVERDLEIAGDDRALDGVPEPELARMLWDELVATVDFALGGARRAGVFVSGGLDSSGVLAAALAQARGASPREIAAVTIAFSGGAGDDTPHLDALCRDLGLEPIRVHPEEGSERLLELFVVDAQPCVSVATVDVAAIRRAKERGVEVMLTGAGGDELLDGEMSTFGHAVGRGQLSAVRDLWRLRGADLPRGRDRLKNWVVYPLLKPLVPARLLEWRRRRVLASALPWLRDRGAVSLAEALGSSERSDDPSPRARMRAFARSRFLHACARLRSQAEIAGDYVRRDPLYFPRFVRFVCTIPRRAFFSGGWTRGLLREALRGRIPESVRLRETKASCEPAFLRLLASAGGFDVLRPLARARRLADLGVVDAARVRDEFAALEARPLENTWAIWSLFAVEAFLERHA